MSVLVAGVLALNLLVIVVAALAIRAGWNSARENADATTMNLARLIERDVSATFDKVDVALGSVVAGIERGGSDRDFGAGSLRRLTQRELDLAPKAKRFAIFGADGERICGPEPAPCPPATVADRDYFTRLRDDPSLATTVSGPLVSRIDGNVSVIVARPLRREGNAFAGIATASIDLQSFASLIASLDLGSRDIVTLRAEDFTLLAKHPPPLRLDSDEANRKVTPEFSAVVKAHPAAGNFSAPSALDGVERSFAYRRFARYPFYVIVGFATETFLDDWRRATVWTVAFAGLFALTSLALTLYFASSWRRREADIRALEQVGAAQRRNEAALEASEEKFRKAFELNPNAMNLTRLDDGCAIAINRGFTRTLGYEADEVVGRTSRELGHWVDIEDRVPMVEALRRDGAVQDYAARFRTKAGNVIDGLVSASVIEIGGVAHLVSTLRDVTEQRRADEALRTSEEKFRLAFDLNPDSMTINRVADGMIVAVNQGYTRLTGYTAEEALGRTALELSRWVDPDERRNYVEALRRDGSVANMDVRFRNSGGQIIDGLLAARTFVADGVPHYIGTVRDVTERKRAEELLKESEERFRRAFDLNLDAMTINRLADGVIVSVNRGFTDATGYSAQDVVGLTSLEINQWVTREQREPMIEALCRDGAVHGYETQFRTKTGAIRDVVLSVSLIDVADGPFYLSNFRDVTAQKAAQALLARLASEQRTTLESDLIALVRVRQGHITWANPAFRKMIDREGADPTGRPARDLFADFDSYAAFDAALHPALRGKDSDRIECEVRRRDGARVWVDIGVAPWDASTGEILAVFVDTSARRQALRELEESEERFRQAFTHAPIGMAICALDGSVLEANPALCRMMGYRAEEMVGRSIIDFDSGEDMERPLALLAQLRDRVTSLCSLELVHHRRNGTRIPVDLTISLVSDHQGRALKLVAQVEDATERIRTQSRELAMAVVKAQEAERGRISHELHDDVGQSLLALKIAISRSRQHAPGALIDPLMAEAGRMVEHLMADVRNIAHRLRPSELDQLGLAAALRSHLDKAIRPMGLAVSFSENLGDARFPADVELSCFRVAQEALTNCTKHANAGSAELSLVHNAGVLTLTVRDDGRGFDATVVLHEGDAARSLGLIGMRERVGALGGSLEIQSQPGAGTTVIATFMVN